MKNLNNIFATTTANGYIADKNGEEDIFVEKNWEIFTNLALEHKNFIWGRKTYEMVVSWGEEYIKCFEPIKIIVISNSDVKYDVENVIVCKNTKEAINILNSYDIKTPFIGDGASIYTTFLKEDLVDKIIISYNSVFLDNGIKLFNEDFEPSNYKITEVNKNENNIKVNIFNLL